MSRKKLGELGARRTHEAGRITAMVPLASLAALISIGIGVDFSSHTIAEQNLRDQAAHCAREGAALATIGADSTIQALQGAQQCIVIRGLNGTATLDGYTLIITLSETYDTKLLNIIGVNHLPLKGTASTVLLPGL